MPQTTTSPKREKAAGRRTGRALWSQSWEERGQGTVEYALIILLIALALIAGLSGYQAALSNAFAWITTNIASTAS